MTPTSMPTNSGLLGVQRARARRHRLLSGQRSGQAEGEDLRREPAEQHHDAADRVVPGGVGGQAGEGGAVVVGHRGERVHDLGQAVRARVEYRCLRRLQRRWTAPPRPG